MNTAKYLMWQAYGRFWAPLFENPWTNYCLDQYVEWGLRWYYYPIQFALDMQEIRDILRGSNVCQPQSTQTLDIKPADVKLPSS